MSTACAIPGRGRAALRGLIIDAAAKLKSPLHVTSDPVAVARYEAACCIELADFVASAEGLIWELTVKPA